MAQAGEAVLIDTVGALHRDAAMPVTAAGALLGVPRSSYYRHTRGYRHYVPVTDPVPHVQRHQPAALSNDERAGIIELILAEKNTDLSVVQLHWRSFDAGLVACSESTFYRVARAQNLTGDRRRTRRTTTAARRAPVAQAGRPGQLWSWDITMLHGPRKQDRYLLYLVRDVFSRFPVAWRIEYAEVPEMAVQMFAEAFETFGVPEVVHADNGPSMRSHALIVALDEAGAHRTHSRPRVSDDNPFSESLFKTVKYDLWCPLRFDDIDYARRWTETFMTRYALEHPSQCPGPAHPRGSVPRPRHRGTPPPTAPTGPDLDRTPRTVPPPIPGTTPATTDRHQHQLKPVSDRSTTTESLLGMSQLGILG